MQRAPSRDLLLSFVYNTKVTCPKNGTHSQPQAKVQVPHWQHRAKAKLKQNSFSWAVRVCNFQHQLWLLKSKSEFSRLPTKAQPFVSWSSGCDGTITVRITTLNTSHNSLLWIMGWVKQVILSTAEMLPSVFGQFSAWDYLHCQVFIGKLMPLGTMEPHQMCGLDSCLGKMHSSQRTWWHTATKLCGKLRLVCRLLLLLLSTCCITAVTLYPHQIWSTSQTTRVSRNKELWIICRILWTQGIIMAPQAL